MNSQWIMNQCAWAENSSFIKKISKPDSWRMWNWCSFEEGLPIDGGSIRCWWSLKAWIEEMWVIIQRKLKIDDSLVLIVIGLCKGVFIPFQKKKGKRYRYNWKVSGDDSGLVFNPTHKVLKKFNRHAIRSEFRGDRKWFIKYYVMSYG